MKNGWLLAALAGLALAMPAHADDKAYRHDATMADLAASYNVQQSEIQNLRDKGWSWNDVGTALAISKRSGQPLQELVAEKDSGMSWSQVADRNGFKLNEVNRESKQLAKDFKRADRQVKRNEAIRHTGEPAPNEEPGGPRSPTSQGPNYPQNPGGPGDNMGNTPNTPSGTP